jgi:hypothetical protein
MYHRWARESEARMNSLKLNRLRRFGGRPVTDRHYIAMRGQDLLQFLLCLDWEPISAGSHKVTALHGADEDRVFVCPAVALHSGDFE